MVRIAVGIITYQDRDGLERLFNSIYDHVDAIIVVDGRYPEWGTEDLPKFSTDGTKEYCEMLDKVKFIELFAPQHEKRTRYMSECKECDLLLVLDADDFVHYTTNWDKFKNFINDGISNGIFEGRYNIDNKQIYNVDFIIGPNHKQWIGRLYYKPYTLKYISHWRVIRDGEEISYPRNRVDTVPGLVCSSNDMTRLKSRVPIDIKYQWDLLYKEGSINRERYTDPNMKRQFENEIYNEVIVWEQYFDKEKKINPLLCFTSPRDISEVNEALDTIPCDKLILKYVHTTRAYKIMQRYFMDHKEYTHLIVHPDDLLVTKSHFDTLKMDIVDKDYQVISGVCDCTTTDSRLAIDITALPHPVRKLRKYYYTKPSDVKGIVKVFWAGFPFTWIRRDILSNIKFEDDTRFNIVEPNNQGWATDVMFHFNCDYNKIPVYADTNVFMRHLKGHELTPEFQIKTGILEPKIYINEKDITQECYDKYLTSEEKEPYYFKDPQTGRKQMI